LNAATIRSRREHQTSNAAETTRCWASWACRPAQRPAAWLMTATALHALPMAAGCQQVIETKYVIVHPGSPMQATENQRLRGRTLAGDAIAEQDVGGWIMMPPDHWDALRRRLQEQAEPTAPETRP
jgi:hypothetical protein